MYFKMEFAILDAYSFSLNMVKVLSDIPAHMNNTQIQKSKLQQPK